MEEALCGVELPLAALDCDTADIPPELGDEEEERLTNVAPGKW